ncbi:hypothetical protein Pst134EB_028681 [Puccinia striiformis f. sp. tritici]|nr:hypothetical protein Pst134EB_028681 [Puccinia striiformis f. sp. tritici]
MFPRLIILFLLIEGHQAMNSLEGTANGAFWKKTVDELEKVSSSGSTLKIEPKQILEHPVEGSTVSDPARPSLSGDDDLIFPVSGQNPRDAKEVRQDSFPALVNHFCPQSNKNRRGQGTTVLHHRDPKRHTRSQKGECSSNLQSSVGQ